MRRALALLLTLSACATAPAVPPTDASEAGSSPALQFVRELNGDDPRTALTEGMKGVLPMGLVELGKQWRQSHGELRWARVASHDGASWQVDALYTASPFAERFDLIFDEQGRLAGLWFRGAGAGSMTAAELRDAFAAIPGKASAFAQAAEHREVTFAFDAERPQSVASQYKVLLLARACAEVGRHTRSLDDRIALPSGVRGLPSCVLCQFDPGLEPTLRDVLHLLMASSDNTAADLLRDVLGPEAIAHFAEQNGVTHVPPLVTTQGLFALECGLGPLRDVAPERRADLLASMGPDELRAAADAAARDGFGEGPARFGPRCGEGGATPDSQRAIAHVVDWPLRADELVALYTQAQLGQLDSPEASRCFVDFMDQAGSGPLPLGGRFLAAGAKNGIEQDVRSLGLIVETDRGPIAVSVSATMFPVAQERELELLYQGAHALVERLYADLPAR